MADGVALPPIEGIPDLVGVLDALVEQRPRGEPPLPALLFEGEHADALVLGFGDRLRDSSGEPVVPHAIIRGRRGAAGDDDIAFFDHVANEISRAAPAGMGRIDLPEYWTVRDILDVATTRRRYREQRRELRDRLYARRRQAQPVVEWLDNLVSSSTSNRAVRFGQALLRPVALDLPRLVFGRRLARGRRFRWFTEQISRVTGRSDDFIAAALSLTHNGPERENDTLVRRVLVLALLRDIDAAFRPSLVSPRQRRRVTPLVLLLPAVGLDEPAHRFLDTLGGLSGEVTRGTSLVLAALAGGTEVPPMLAPPAGGRTLTLHQAADALEPLLHGRPIDDRVLAVEATGPADDERAAAWLAVNRRVQPVAPRLPLLVPVLTLGLSTVVVVALLVAAWTVLRPESSCPGITSRGPSGERIGVGDGTTACTFFADPASEVERDQQAVEREIALENERVLADADDDRPYATVVFFAPMTQPRGPETLGQTSLPQLRGAALAQAEANRAARNDRNTVPIRVLLANPGGQFRFGREVAGQISELVGNDDRLVGVVGIAQSRTSSREAIEVLAGGSLPVVAGPVTGDRMIGSSEYYYQVSPRNERVAEMLVDFATRTKVVGADTDLRVARRAVIVKDHSDEYSDNLADDLRQSFTGQILGTFSYAEEDATTPVPEGEPDEVVGSFADLAAKVCPWLQDDVVIFYASRAAQLSGMLNALDDNTLCSQPITVVGGTDLTKFVSSSDDELQRYGGSVRLYYGAFASPTQRDESSALDQFFTGYSARYGDSDLAADISDPALTFDAFSAMQKAVNQVWERGLELRPDLVATELANGTVVVDGATGYVNLDDDNRVPLDKLVLVLEAGTDQAAPPTPRLSCGKLGSDVEHTTWGDGFPCASDLDP